MATRRPPQRPIQVVLEAELTRWFRELGRQALAGRKEAQTLKRALDRLLETLSRDFQHGEVVPKSKIPPSLVSRFGVSNLYVEDLPDFHRMLYSVEGAEQVVTVLILTVFDHSEYDRLFRIRRR